MAGALSHLRVVELCDGLPVAYCGRQFATWGAEVVRVEPPGGSALRHMEPVVPTTRGSRLSLTWEYISANKQIAFGDAEQPGFADELRGLLRGADVLITDWPRARIAAAGIDLADTVRQMPRLVVLLFSDFGDGGPYAGFQATDLVLQALTAYMSVNGWSACSSASA